MKSEKEKYVWVDDDNCFLKGYLKERTDSGNPPSLLGRIISFFKELLKLR
jgi:hypothetical protein